MSLYPCIKQEHQREVDRLTEKLRYQEDEITAMKVDREDAVVRERAALQVSQSERWRVS